MVETIRPDGEKVNVEAVIEQAEANAANAQPVAPAEVVPTPEQIMAKIAAAGASSDLAEVIRLGNQLKKHQGDIMKAEADKLKAEAEAMAGDRAKLADEVLKTIPKELEAKLVAVKAAGYTFKLAYTDPQGVAVKPAVALSIPTIKAKSSGGGGGSTGALKAQTGLSRHELVEQFATDPERAGIAKAEAEATSRPDSARYIAEKPVIKRILADNPHLIKH